MGIPNEARVAPISADQQVTLSLRAGDVQALFPVLYEALWEMKTKRREASAEEIACLERVWRAANLALSLAGV